jgi:DNA polymerase (family X)
MRADAPESVLEMLTIPGLRPEKVLKLHKELGINTFEELETASKQDRLKAVKGLGPALQRKILVGLEARQSTQEARHVHRAAEVFSIRNLDQPTKLRFAELEVTHERPKFWTAPGWATKQCS